MNENETEVIVGLLKEIRDSLKNIEKTGPENTNKYLNDIKFEIEMMKRDLHQIGR